MPRLLIRSGKFLMMRLLQGLEVIFINKMTNIDLELVVWLEEDKVKVKISNIELTITKISKFQN